MDSSPFGSAELIVLIILLIIGLWWFLAFLPKKVALASSVLMASFSPAPEQPPVPALEKAEWQAVERLA